MQRCRRSTPPLRPDPSRAKKRPVATTSSITTYDADMRVWGILPEQFAIEKPDGFRWSTLTCRGPPAPAARLHTLFTGVQSAFQPEAARLRLFGGVTHQTTQICPLIARAFALSISGAKSLSAALKG